RVEVKVGSYGAKTYRAELRRIIQGDRNPQGPGYRDEPIPIDLGEERKARRQDLTPGSYVQIRDRGDVLASLQSFTIAVPIWATRLGTNERSIICLPGLCTELFIDEAGIPSVHLGSARLTLTTPLVLKRWALLVATFDSSTGKLRLSCLRDTNDLGEEAET